MRARLIFEKFFDESDPIHDMNIGENYLWDNLKVGDVIVCKKPNLYLNYNHRFSNKHEHNTKYSSCIHTPIELGEQLIISQPPTKFPNIRNDKPMLHILYQYKIRGKERNRSYYDLWIEENVDLFKKYFDIIPK